MLIDLVGSFEPEPGHEQVASATGQRPLKSLVQEAAALLSSDVEYVHRHAGSDEEARLAGELLALIRE